MAEDQHRARASSTDDELLERAGRDEAGAVQPALPARHRPARQHRPARRRCAGRSPASTPSSASARSPPPRRSQTRRTLMADETTTETEPRANARKVREGIVVSNKMDKTAVVAVIERVRHPRYAKTVQRTKKLYVHDEANDAQRRRPGPRAGDPPAVEAEALAGRRSAGAGPMIQQEIAPPGRRQQRRQGGAVHQGARRLHAAATPRSATSSSPPSRTPSPAPP